MTDIKTVYTTDATQAQREIEKLQRETVKLREKNQQLANSTRENAKAASAGNSEMIKGAAVAVAGLLSVKAAVGAVTQAYSEWREEMKQLGVEHVKVSEKIVHELAGAGLSQQAQQWQDWIERFPGATRETVMAGMAGVTASAAGVDETRRKELISTAVSLELPFGNAQQIGELLGHLEKLDPSKSADDLGDLAAKILADSGKFAGEMISKKFLEAGELFQRAGAGSLEEFLGLGMEMVTNQLSPKLVETIALSLQDRGEVVERQRGGPELTPEQMGKNRFAAAGDARQALELLLGDREVAAAVLGKDQASRLSLLKPDALSRGAAGMREAMAGDRMQAEREALERSEAGRTLLRERSTQSRLEEAKTPMGIEGARRQAVYDRLEAALIETGHNWLTRAIAKGVVKFAETAYDIDTSTGTMGIFASAFDRMLQRADQQTGLLEQQNELLRDLRGQRPQNNPHAHNENR